MRKLPADETATDSIGQRRTQANRRGPVDEQLNGTPPDGQKQPYNPACFPRVFFHTVPTRREKEAILSEIGLSNFDATCSPDSGKNRVILGLTFREGPDFVFHFLSIKICGNFGIWKNFFCSDFSAKSRQKYPERSRRTSTDFSLIFSTGKTRRFPARFMKVLCDFFLDKQFYKIPTSFLQVESNFFPSFPASAIQCVSGRIFLCFVSRLFPYFTIRSEASLSAPFRLDSSRSVSCHQNRIHPQLFGVSEQLEADTIHAVVIG